MQGLHIGNLFGTNELVGFRCRTMSRPASPSYAGMPIISHHERHVSWPPSSQNNQLWVLSDVWTKVLTKTVQNVTFHYEGSNGGHWPKLIEQMTSPYCNKRMSAGVGERFGAGNKHFFFEKLIVIRWD